MERKRRLLKAIGAGVTAAVVNGGRNSGWYTHLAQRRGQWAAASPHWDEVEPGSVSLSPWKALAGAGGLGALFGVGYVAARPALPPSELMAGATYGVGCFLSLEVLNKALPPEHRLQRRVFREPVTALFSLATAGVAVAWFSRPRS